MATFTDMGTGLNTVDNPAVHILGMTSTVATSAGDKVFLALEIPNDNPTFAANGVQFDGQNMVEESRSARGGVGGTVVVFRYDDAAGRASGKTFTIAWTNAGTQNGGGACATASKTDALIAGPSDTTAGTQNGSSTTPTTRASGTPLSPNNKYVALAVLGGHGSIASAGLATPDNSYTAMAESYNATRARSLYTAMKEFTPAVGAQTETWTVTWPGARLWSALILVYEEIAAGAPVYTVAPAMTGTPSVGSTLSTDDGSSTNTPTSFTYRWQRDVGTGGATWLNIPGASANSYVVTNDDIGSKVRAVVVANNASGDSIPAASNATAVTIPVPSGVESAWIVGGPLAQSDGQTHVVLLDKPVPPGCRVVILAGCSNANTIDGNGNKSDVGSFTDPGGNVYAQDSEAFSDANIQHSGQAFSAACPLGLSYQAAITMIVNGGVGAGGYHGQSPNWHVWAISSGDSRPMVFDKQAHQVDLLTAHAAPNITTSKPTAVVFGFHVGEPQGTPAATTVSGLHAANSSTLNVINGAALAASGTVIVNGRDSVTYTGVTGNQLTGVGSHPSYVGGETVTNTWWSATAGFTKAVETPRCDSGVGTFAGESGYNTAAEVQIVTGGYTGGAGGTTLSNKTITNLVVAYIPLDAATAPPLSPVSMMGLGRGVG